MANTQHHILFILDRSGSMEPRREDVIGGFNNFIPDIRDGAQPEIETFVSLVQFDDTDVIKLARVPSLMFARSMAYPTAPVDRLPSSTPCTRTSPSTAPVSAKALLGLQTRPMLRRFSSSSSPMAKKMRPEPPLRPKSPD